MIEKAQAASFDLNFLRDTASHKTSDSLAPLANKIIDSLLFVAGALAVIYIIYSGILYVTSAGNPDSAKKGQQGLINGAIGIVIIVLAYYMANAIAKYAGSNIG
jgi:hypothetical protein